MENAANHHRGFVEKGKALNRFIIQESAGCQFSARHVDVIVISGFDLHGPSVFVFFCRYIFSCARITVHRVYGCSRVRATVLPDSGSNGDLGCLYM